MDKIPFENLDFRPLLPILDLTSFSCTDPELNDFLYNDSKDHQNERFAATRLTYFGDDLVGFFTLTNDTITAKSVEGNGKTYPYRKLPAIKIARLATHQEWESRNVATNMIRKIFEMVINLSKHSGCRFITVDSKNTTRALRFYQEKIGFVPALTAPREETIPLYLDFHAFVSEEMERQEKKLDEFFS